MQRNIDVSVVIPCYNAGQYLTRSVESILAQTFRNIKIIIVNDGSNDKITLKILRKLKNKRIQVINKKFWIICSKKFWNKRSVTLNIF